MNHAPGPWKLTQESIDPEWHIVTAGVRLIANVHIEKGNTVDLANAKLIVSAPALLEALKALMTAYGASDGRNGNSGECWDLARAARAATEED